MTNGNVHVKYDTLLKPVQDNLLKDWGLSLSIFLEDFMDHLEKTAKMNFSEAAMVVQNGTAFYCKRVDVVYKTIHEFVADICSVNDNADSAGTHKNSDGKTRKKKVKTLEEDDLQILDFVSSDHAIDAKMNALVFQGPPKQIVLCTSMKALRKAGTSVTVYQAIAGTLGCKDEFRVFGKTYADGTVNEDFNVDHENRINPVDETVGGDDGMADDSFGGFEDPVVRGDDDPPDVPVNEILPPEPEIPPSGIPGFSTLGVEPTIPVAQERCAPARPKRKKNFEWEPILVDFKIVIKPSKLGQSLNVPNECLDDETVKDLDKMKVKARKRKRGKAEPENDEAKFRIRWIDEAIKLGSFDLSEMNITKEKLKRKQLLAAKPKPDNVDHEDSISHFEDPAQDDFEAFQDDAELVSAAPVNRFDAMIQEDDRHEYADEALKAIEKFKETRRENATRQTDIAKRVAKWHEAIMPKLAEAEARSHLDVHEYGTRILNMFPDDDPKFLLKFHNIVKDEPTNEICRYLLATLMLANTYNVEIIKRGVPLINTQGMYCDYVELRLITKTRHHEEMDEALRVTSGDCGS